MKTIRIRPRELSGKIKIPPSKSMSHRGIICGALADGESRIENLVFSDDINATIKAMETLGAKFERGKDSVSVAGSSDASGVKGVIDCIESGSTIRFLIPIASVLNAQIDFVGRGRLIKRPLDIYSDIFKSQGISHDYTGVLPFSVGGSLKPGTFRINGNVSSQFISGLMFSLPLLDGDSQIEIVGPLESKGYVDLTISALSDFGVEIENINHEKYIIRGNQGYNPRDYRVEGDYSQAAFWIVAGLIGGKIECRDIRLDSLQGDKEIIDIVSRMGVDLESKKDTIIAKRSDTKGTVIDASQCPDIIPVLCVLASLSEGETRVINGQRLRIKESDRIKSTVSELSKLGADIEETEDGMIIRGKKSLKGGRVNSWKDHRIAMALAVASIRCQGDVIIEDADAVTKSYPGFYEDFVSLGGEIDG